MVDRYKYISRLYGIAVNGYGVLQKNIIKQYALPPISARIILTYRCNCVCHFCNAHFPSKEEMTLNGLEQILRQIPRGSILTFTGGEITLLKDFLPMMKLAAKHHKVKFFTSGSTLKNNKGMIRELIDVGVWGITFSIDVPNDTHNKIRGPEGLLQNVIEAINEITNIRKQKKSIKPLLQINSVILKESIPFLPEMVRFSVKLGVDYLSFGLLELENYDENDLKSFREQLPMALEIAKNSKFTVTLQADVQAVYNAIKDYSGDLKNGVPKERIQMSNFACLAPWSTLFIEPNGMTHICRDGIADGMANTCQEGMKKYNSSIGTLGNIKNVPLKELWNNQIAQNWRKSIIGMKELPPSCLNCCLISRIQ